MFGAGFDPNLLMVVRTIGAMLFSGFAIKLMDDFMDLRRDSQYGVPSLAVRLGEATLPYSLVALAVATLFDVRFAATLFLASYAVGMAGDLNRPLPSGLLGWQEGIAALLCGTLLGGLWIQAWSLIAIGFVQCVDDIADARRDTMGGSANLVHRWGLGEIRLAALGLLIVAVLMSPVLTGLLIFCVAAIETVVWRLAIHRPGHQTGSHPRGWLE